MARGRRWVLALMLGLVAATAFGCGEGDDDDSGDGSSADAAPLADATPLADAAPLADAKVCAPGACDCFTNDDCPEGYACVSQDEEGAEVYCEIGERGTGEVGAPCQDESDCASGLCWENSEQVGHCSGRCEVDDDCPIEVPTCLYIGGDADDLICADLT